VCARGCFSKRKFFVALYSVAITAAHFAVRNTDAPTAVGKADELLGRSVPGAVPLPVVLL
jgi:hypothetical protein